ncbi:MAG: 12,18-didecarboxysiroheme deacetylase [candidate division Zixibacteria bacterium]|nr:12,18-didecarboxysiroheme deacetylase [candidate division Zixibacteria bacterium]
MIGISKLYCGTVEPSDPLRYNRKSKDLPSSLLQFSADKKPVVVWNITRRCNLKCVHCYSASDNLLYPDELSTEEGKKLIDDLASFEVPVLLFSGGEPLTRPDFFELASYAVSKGIRAVISTNGTLITEKVAEKLKGINLSYVGISLDGVGLVNDEFRGEKGAFQKALEGIRNCQKLGLKVGLRFTINKRNYKQIPEIFKLLEDENIPRACFYHLVYAGRGSELKEEDLDLKEKREIVDEIIDLTYQLYQKGLKKEVLTVDNHADGVYLYLRMKREGNKRSEEVLELLKMNEGNSSGRGIGCISWDGEVYPDQFWRNQPLGNVREKKFSQIWTDLSHPLLSKLKDKKPHLKGRCAKCIWLDICAGNFRARAEAATGDIWAPDPACYLTDEEIGIKEGGLR